MLKRTILVLLCFCLCIPFAASAPHREVTEVNAASNTTINQDKQQLAELQNKLNNIKNNLSELEKDKQNSNTLTQTLLEEKIQLEKEYTLINDQVNTISDIITGYNSIIETAETDRAKMEANLKKQLDDFGIVLVELYKNGDDSKFEIFLRSDSYYSYISYVEYMEQILKSSDMMIEDIKATIADIEQRKQDHEEAKVKLEEKMGELEIAKKELEAKDKELDEKLGEERDKIEFTDKEKEEYKRQEEELLKDIQKLQQQIKDKLAASYTGSFSWPFASNVSYWISSRFGIRTDGPFTSYEHHNGLDIVCARYTPIRAVDNGIVTYAGNRGAFGNVVFVEHDGGLTTIYAHCDSLLVTAGTKVLKDQVIARVGSTGQSNGYHLHFAVQKNGVYVDPEKYLPPVYTKGY